MIATLRTDVDPIEVDDFPAVANPRNIPPRPTPRTTGVRLDADEEATQRFGAATEIDHDTTQSTTPMKDHSTMSTSTKNRRSRTTQSPRMQTREAWRRYREASEAFYEACARYEAERRGYPGPGERTTRQDRLIQIWESITDELCQKYVKAAKAVRRAVRHQRRAQLLEQVTKAVA